MASKLWEKVFRPMAFRLDAERVHELGLKALELGLASAPAFDMPQSLAVERFGLSFANPLGIAAGFDKNGKVVGPLAKLGFGFVEVGTVTHRAQPGNEKPRLFRLSEDKALINRLGFNNEGAAAVASRLKERAHPCVIGVNIGRNKDVSNDQAIENYLAAFEIVHPVADYIVINVSSPNTPGLRDLQASESLSLLLDAIQEKDRELGSKPLLVKVAPDLTDKDLASIIGTCLEKRIAGIIATNTTISRDGLRSKGAGEWQGGLSGQPLRQRSTEVISAIYRISAGKLPIIGVGGIFTAEDAFEKIAAGASLVQAYTGFIYGGPTFARDVVLGLARILEERGMSSIDGAVGSGVRD